VSAPDTVLDRVGKSGPVVMTIIAVLGAAAAYGANSLQTSALVKSQEATNAKIDAVYAELRKISETVVGVKVTSEYQGQALAELRTRTRELEARLEWKGIPRR
jgi:hypothetical protein